MKTINYDLLYNILEELNSNHFIKEEELAKKYQCSERTIRRYIKILKDSKIVKLKDFGKKREWVINV